MASAIATYAPEIIKGVASIGSAALGAFGSGSGNSALSIKDQEHLMDYQWELNQKTAYMDNIYNKEAEKRQFNYNKWFAQNSYQNAVSDLRSAGLNPLLVNPNSAGGSVGLSNTSAPGAGLLDPASVTSANASKKQADIAQKLGIVNALCHAVETYANGAKSLEEATTEGYKRSNIEADTNLKTLQSMRQQIENSNLDDRMKSEIKHNISTAEASLINARIQEILAPSQINYNNASAKSVIQNSVTNRYNAYTQRAVDTYNAETQRINARSNRENAKSNRENAKSNRMNARTRSAEFGSNLFKILR